MRIVTGSSVDLEDKFHGLKSLLSKCGSTKKRFALYNYLVELRSAIWALNGKAPKGKIFLSDRDQSKYLRYMDALLKQNCDNFIKYKQFHSKYIDDIINSTADDLQGIAGLRESNEKDCFSPDEFYEVFFEFMRGLKLEREFDNYVRLHKMYTTRDGQGDIIGQVIINPISGDRDIIFKKFSYTLNDMLTMAHEFGHVYDLELLDKENLANDLFQYGYVSIYGEVISRAFEKLFLHYVEDNNIMREKSRDLHIDSLFSNRHSLIALTFLTILDDGLLRSGEYRKLRPDEMVDLLVDEYDDVGAMLTFLSYYDVNLGEDQIYGYGEVLSLFLSDSIQKEGLDNPLLASFLQERVASFTPKFIEMNDLNPNKYQKIYKKEIERCKK